MIFNHTPDLEQGREHLTVLGERKQTMKIELAPGEKIMVIFGETDREITVSFNEKSIEVHTAMPDSIGRQRVIYLAK